MASFFNIVIFQKKKLPKSSMDPIFFAWIGEMGLENQQHKNLTIRLLEAIVILLADPKTMDLGVTFSQVDFKEGNGE